MKKIATISAILLAGFSAPANAEADALLEGAKLCTRHMPQYERQYGIPTHLLSAIGTTESGRYHKQLKISVPWPWTINAEGKGYYFDSKAEAIAAARSLRMQGVKSMDVGCMQVNLYHHANAFSSLEAAFDPETNVAYASSFLRSLYGESNSWKKAAADYHSKTPQRGSEYVGMVFNSWYKIIDKLRAARMALPDVPAQQQVASNIAAAQAQDPAPEMKVVQASAPAYQGQDTEYVKYIKPTSIRVQPTRLPEQEGRKVASYHSPRMYNISVSDKNDRRDSGIIVVKPEIKVVDSMSATSAPTIRVAQARVDSAIAAAAASDAPKKSGPRFIFTD